MSVRVASYAARVLGKLAPAADVEDVSAEAVARAFEAVGDASTNEVVTEALRCVRSLARSRRRRRRRGRLRFVPRIPASVSEPPPDVAGALDRAAMIEALERDLADDAQARALVRATLVGAVTRAQLAEALGVSEAEVHNAQRRLYRRARRLLGGREE